jgi:hypothetical protein
VAKINNNQLSEKEHLAFLSIAVEPAWKQVMRRMQSMWSREALLGVVDEEDAVDVANEINVAGPRWVSIRMWRVSGCKWYRRNKVIEALFSICNNITTQKILGASCRVIGLSLDIGLSLSVRITVSACT